ncbi:hypothetical protein Tco_0205595 [Tanacetum coccineum]
MITDGGDPSIKQVRGNPTMPSSTRRQLATDPECRQSNVALSVNCAQECEMGRTQLRFGFNYYKIPLYSTLQSAMSNIMQPRTTFANKALHTPYQFHKGTGPTVMQRATTFPAIRVSLNRNLSHLSRDTHVILLTSPSEIDDNE